MTDRRRHIEGFTLAEVMLAVAIILVLAAIAFPSIISAQKNMRMMELDNAAEAIANAAQIQMTAKKSDGTWWPLIESGGEGSSAQQVKYGSALNPPAAALGTDTYYLTADQARDSGIIPEGAVDAIVRDGDYIIEFTASTATVVSVFYTDGKTGFFGSAPASTNAAQDYYTAGGARDRASRMSANPMIGYFEGTPSSATKTVAVQNPVIWLNEEKSLCVQDKNLSGGGSKSWDTETAVRITKKGADAPTITIAGLSVGGSGCTITADGPAGDDGVKIHFEHEFSRAELSEVIKMASKTETAPQDVYAIDVSQLITFAQSNPAYSELSAVLSTFSADEEVQVDAQVDIPESKNISYVPAKAKAFVQWPSQRPKIYLYATNPEPSATPGGTAGARHIEGQFTAPVTGLTGKDVLGLWNTAPDSSVPVKNTPSTLADENPEAGQQKYSGGYVELSKAVEAKAKLRAEAGAYRPQGSTSAHQYQISEIWLSVSAKGAADGSGEGTADGSGAEAAEAVRQRVGYLNQNKWTWENTAWGNLFKQCVALESDTSGSSAFTSLTVDCQKLNAQWPVDESSAGYEIYVRTTPKLDEVGDWFERNITELAGKMGTTTTGSRGVNHGAAIRKLFENEFGAPSTVALWEITKAPGTMRLADGSSFPSEGDLRVYYSATPAVAWGAGGYTDDTVTNALPSAALWLYDKDGGAYTRERSALVWPAKEGEENYHLVKSDSADFEIPYSRDELFYRVFEYFDKDNDKPLEGYGPVYVPYLSQDGEYAKFKSFAITTEIDSFQGWAVYQNGQQVLDTNGKQLMVSAGATPAQYDDVLPYGAVQLYARYVKAVPGKAGGLVYVGLNEQGKKVAYGFADGEKDQPSEYLLTNEAMGSVAIGKYYLAVSWNYDVQWCSVAYNKNRLRAYLGPTAMKLYQIEAQPKETRAVSYQVRTIYSVVSEFSRSYYVNLDFARAVTVNKPTSDAWGTAAGKPWQIELPQQFPGALSSEKQEKYRGDHFLQTRDLDFSGTKHAGFSQKFTGGYDGGGHSIAGAENVIGTMSYAGTACASGLFPQTENAQLSGINLVFGSPRGGNPSLTYDDANNPVTYFGCLVGYASGGSISGCTVSARQGASFTANLHSLQSSPPATSDEVYNAAGALAARTKGTTLENCSASNVRLSLRTENGEWNSANSRNYFGGLVGVADISGFAETDKPLLGLTAENIGLTIEDSKLASGKDLSLGGLFGRLWVGATSFQIDGSWTWSARSVAIDANLGLDRAGISSRLFAGSAIGNLAASGTLKSDCTGMAENEGVVFVSDGENGRYERDLSAYGPLYGRIPLTDGWAYEPAGLLYVSGAAGDGWSARGYAAGNEDATDATIAKKDAAQADLEAGGYYLSLPTERGCEDAGAMKAERLDGTYTVNGEERSLFKVATSSASSQQYETVQLPVTGGVDQPKTRAYYVNFNFANALTTDEAVARSWGTDASPWQVALATQFPGALPAAVQAERLGDSYLQTGDIDFSEFAGISKGAEGAYPGFTAAFTGTFDGGGCVIAQAHDGISTMGENNGKTVRQGLFPLVQGGTLKNVKLTIENRSGVDPSVDLGWTGGIANNDNGWTLVGCLAGLVSERSTVENCSLAGVVSNRAGTDMVTLEFTNMRDLTSQVGLLVGRATESTLAGCSVNNVEANLAFEAGAVERQSRYLNLGGIVGSIEGTSSYGAVLSRASVTHMGLTVGGTLKDRWARTGGIAGFVGQATTLADEVGDSDRAHMGAEDVLICFTQEQGSTSDLKKRVEDALGGLVGRIATDAATSPAINVAITDIATRFGNVRSRFGSGAETSLSQWYGNTSGNVVLKQDAAQLAGEARAAEIAAQETAAREAADREAAAQAAKEAERAKREEAERDNAPKAEDTPKKEPSAPLGQRSGAADERA